MWMLITVLCLQTSSTDADCRREVQHPVAARLDCWRRMPDQKAALLALADDINARVLFLSVSCQKGRDG